MLFIIHHFVDCKSKEMKLHTPPAISPGAINRLRSYQWPGNVRELENVVERALILYRGRVKSRPLTFDHFVFQQAKDKIGTTPERNDEAETLDEVVSFHIKRTLNATNGKIEGPGGAAERLRIKPSTLRARMKKLGIQRKRK